MVELGARGGNNIQVEGSEVMEACRAHQLTGERVCTTGMYNPTPLHGCVTRVQGGNVRFPHRYTPLHVFTSRQAGRHTEPHKFIAK